MRLWLIGDAPIRQRDCNGQRGASQGVSVLDVHKRSRHQGAVMTDPHEERSSLTPNLTLEGKYANYFEVGYNAFEVLIDFGQLYMDGSNKQLHTRVVTNPPYAKELLRILAKTIQQYEDGFGPIQVDE